jgi:hypothetical protein
MYNICNLPLQNYRYKQKNENENVKYVTAALGLSFGTGLADVMDVAK